MADLGSEERHMTVIRRTAVFGVESVVRQLDITFFMSCKSQYGGTQKGNNWVSRNRLELSQIQWVIIHICQCFMQTLGKKRVALLKFRVAGCDNL